LQNAFVYNSFNNSDAQKTNHGCPGIRNLIILPMGRLAPALATNTAAAAPPAVIAIAICARLFVVDV